MQELIISATSPDRWGKEILKKKRGLYIYRRKYIGYIVVVFTILASTISLLSVSSSIFSFEVLNFKVIGGSQLQIPFPVLFSA